MSAQPEVWRVSTVEGIFETDLETLKQWISEGCVLPTDKVSKGTLNWIDAGRAPMLRAAFAGDFSPQPPKQPVYPEAAGGWQIPPPFEHTPEPEPTHEAPPYTETHRPPPINDGFASSANTCQNHPDAAAHFVCRMCSALWCETCPRFVSGKIPLCPSCGDLCKLYKEVTTKAAQSQFQASGFGIADFGRAIRYPFQHKFALVCGALIYGLLLLAGFKGALVAWMIMFGCISHVINQVACGGLNRSFMPDFSAFSIWDDFVVPIFLGLGISIVTWGPMIALVIALLLGVLQGPGLPQVMPGQELPATAEGMLLPYLGAGILLLVLFLLALGWAFFYYPMALTVAGYTQSVGAVINPLVGLDTIKRMGLRYFKAFAMVVVVQIVAGVVGVIIGVITSPFNLPFVGNLPANFINGTATFYFNLVIACVLGLSLYKCADRLGINVD